MNNFSAPTPISDLWRIARAFLTDALNALGGPQTIRQTLDLIARRAIKRQLQALETLVMKLLLIEAANLPAQTPRTRTAPSGKERITRAADDPAHPETWRVAFQLQIPPEPKGAPGPRVRYLGPSGFIRAKVVGAQMLEKLERLVAAHFNTSAEDSLRAKATKLARRFEALRRVFANPLPRARRLKQKLQALKHRAFAAARRIAHAKPPQRQLDPLLNERAEYAAQFAVPAFNSS
ncbi:MAG: hypothetical protein NT015_09805 [Alphaproteobacteria bacterium]|nr:hypothetical protein [Alphaproteobacteria bacterium]